MKKDEADHRVTAEEQGAAKLPLPVKLLMQFTSRLMTFTAYKV